MKKMRLPISEQYFDELKHYDLVEDFMGGAGVSGEVLQFATDMYGTDTGVCDILNYYDLEEDFENYLKDNREDYVLDSDEDEDE